MGTLTCQTTSLGHLLLASASNSSGSATREERTRKRAKPSSRSTDSAGAPASALQMRPAWFAWHFGRRVQIYSRRPCDFSRYPGFWQVALQMWRVSVAQGVMQTQRQFPGGQS